MFLNGENTRITEEVLEAAVSESSKQTIQQLMSREMGFQATLDILQAAAGNFEAMEVLLSRDQDVKIPEKIFRAAATHCASSGEVMMQLLLSRNKKIQITEAVVEAAAGNDSPKAMQFLLDLNPKIEITETALIEALRSKS